VAVDDLDGDGFGDFAAGAPTFFGGGFVYLISGRDGHLLRSFAAEDVRR